MKAIFKDSFSIFIRKDSALEQLLYVYNSKFRFKKLMNIFSSKLNRYIKYTGRLPYYPTQVSIEPTTACNYRCPSCFHGIEGGKEHLKKRDRFMDFDKYKKFIDEIHEHVWMISLTGCGESFLHPNIYEMLGYASEKGLAVTLENNGSAFDPEKLAATEINKIHFGVDCTTQDSYAKYRIGGNIEKVLEKVTSYCEILESRKERPAVHLRFLVNKYTEDDAGKLEEIFSRFDFVKVYYDAFIVPSPDLETLMKFPSTTTLEKFEEWHPRKMGQYNIYRYDKKTDSMRDMNLLNDPAGTCPGVYGGAMLNTDGSIYPCCVAHSAMPQELCYGNAFEQGFFETWNSKKARTFRGNYKKNKGSYGFCEHCPSGRG
ncbi:SPASM domain-containing protein [Maridesulfovibrio sp.]|uniref:radical SAM protein n=1 Tax=Maridesulfovibrio sp. TaxID=2795000 RepID=UPI0029F5B4E7|nr:radical SAM protein [Maridesulfovibrio sp.]